MNLGNLPPDFPFGDYHEPKPWQSVEGSRSGFACPKCHKTWEWIDRNLKETHGERVITPEERKLRRAMTGFFATLTPEQKAKILEERDDG